MESIRSIKKLSTPTGPPHKAVPSTLLGGAANSPAAAEATEEGVSGPTKQAGRTAVQKTADRSSAAKPATSYQDRSRAYWCIPKSSPCIMSFGSYPVTRNVSPAEQGRSRYSGRYGQMETPPSGTREPFPAQLAGNNSGRVGAGYHGTIKGYRIKFLRSPCQRGKPPQLSFTEKEEECMQEEIQSMLDKKAISVAGDSSESFFSQMFLVPKKDGRQRPVINLKRLNQSVKSKHFKMEGIHMLKDLLRAGDWMAKIDLKDAYFMIPIAQEDRDFLKFQWRDQTYQFNCLPFGLSSAPWVFTKTTRPVVAALREIGLRLIIYIHDILVMAETESLLKDHVTAVVYLLENLGFVINHPKSELDPSQEIEFLGFTVNSKRIELKLPGEKIKKIRAEAGRVLQSDTVSALTLSRLIWKMNAATQAIPMAPLHYRNLQTCLREALQEDQSYASTTVLTKEAREELESWRDHFTQWNGRSLIAHNSSLTIETDASKKGWGAVCNGVRTGGPWTPEERTMHINCLELLAAFLAVKCFAKDKTNLTIHLKMDSMSALTYINKLGGTISPQLNTLAKELWLWCMERSILLKAQHLAGVLNTIADDKSRVMKDRTDWKLCPAVFWQINQRMGPLEVDLFASRLTYQLRQFVSWRPDPMAIATDAFTLNWAKLKAYANPPWNLIGRVLAQTRLQQAELVLVAPVWKAQGWYPVLLEMLVEVPLLIPLRRDLITAKHEDSLPEVVPQLAVWAISGSATRTAEFLRGLRNCSWHHGDRSPPGHMTHSLESGSAGVVDGTVILFHVL